jgi:hypothetical protein
MVNGCNTYGPAVALCEDCIALCRDFIDVVFKHCPREANMAAHTISSKAEGSVPIVWKDYPPGFFG